MSERDDPCAVGPDLDLPSTGPDPVPFATALDAVVGYACGRRALRFRSPGTPEGRWVRVPAFGWARFDARPVAFTADDDIMVAEALHGRLDRAGWAELNDVLAVARPLADDAAARAAGRPFWALPDEELSVLGEPGTVGAALRRIAELAGAAPSGGYGGLGPGHSGHVLAALHRRHPALVPHLTRTTRRALLPFSEEGDSGVEAVVRRELRANDEAFAALEVAVAARTDAAPTRLRLHDVLLWLTTTLRLPAAVALGEQSCAAGGRS